MTQKHSCPGCEITLTKACVQRVPVPLCGVCKLLDEATWETYFGRWNPSVAEVLGQKEPGSCSSRCT